MRMRGRAPVIVAVAVAGSIVSLCWFAVLGGPSRNRGANGNTLTSKLDAELLRSINKGDVDSATHLLDRGASANSEDPDGRTALMFAANKDPRILRALLSRGAKVNGKDRWGRTALYMTSRTSSYQRQLLLEAGGKE